ncbi:hypothetical protein Taro_047842 [Colocasia esculenta]|uniref:BHLH domain-containing protein n=1 Tax=Colocasia esculenta TaxID=4460 RepID=A0A843X5V5_COLES|nr:hypothetical protein [Colocasia esculenta]
MGTFSELRRSLWNLCHGTPWKYAVFWKLKHRSRMLLTWQDGYCVPTKPRDAVEDISQNGIFNGEAGIISLTCEMDALGGSSTECPIELAVANMSCHLYSLGEGVIGKVAFTGKHHWIFSKSLDSKTPSEYHEEWQVQFAAGIQTILLVPVVPYGVVQLGSLEMVMEDLKIVTYIKDLFSRLQHTNSASFSLDGDPFNPLSSPSSPAGRIFSSFSTASVDQWIQPQLQLSRKKDLVVPKVEQMTKHVPNVNFHNPLSSSVPDDLSLTQNNTQHILGMDMGLCVDGNSWKAIYNAISGSVNEELCIANHSLSSDRSTEDGIPCYSPRSDLKEPHQFNIMQSAIVCSDNEDLQGGYNYCFVKKINDQALGVEDFKEMSSKASDSGLNFPIDSELHKALGSAFLQEHDTCFMDMWFSGENVLSSSFPASKVEENGIHDLASAESSGWLLKQNDTEHLLDAVISSFYASDDSCSNPSRGTSPSDSSGQFGGSCLTNIKLENDALAADNSGLMNHEKSFLLTKHGLFSTSLSGFQSQSKSTSMLMDEEQQNGKGCEQFKRNMKLQCVGKRKAKIVDVHKPRPRDRQLIQDRIKELRDLVPNGSKCSIDALLDRTIKHMLFLQSISSQAEKLKQYAHSKVDGEKRKPTEPAVHQKGASWAYDLGSQTEVCPIVVENLEQPGHMLVEMLCNEYGLFLEIAQVIKHLELTILKGVLENRSHKLWAHFIVELMVRFKAKTCPSLKMVVDNHARCGIHRTVLSRTLLASRGFHRMDILWPLMQLLQRQSCPITSTF